MLEFYCDTKQYFREVEDELQLSLYLCVIYLNSIFTISIEKVNSVWYIRLAFLTQCILISLDHQEIRFVISKAVKLKK